MSSDVEKSSFDILSINPDADEEEIEQAYRQLVKETHPDHGGSAQEFQLVKTAYEDLISDYQSEEQTISCERGGKQPYQTEARVEYLNYEMLDDLGLTLGDNNLFEKASTEGLDEPDHGRLFVQPTESLLEAAENSGFRWPYACRGGACTNCAVAVAEGELSMPVDHILPSEMTDRGILLSCVGTPLTDEIKIIYNIKRLPKLEDLQLPSPPFERAQCIE